MATHRMYVEIDDLSPLIEWLQTRPKGRVNVLIGKCATGDPIQEVLKQLQTDRRLANWMLSRMQSGKMDIRAYPDPVDLEIGVVVTTN